MIKLRFSIEIKAPKEKVWDTMLSDETYRQWTEAFSPGSYFEGSWDEGADIKFLASKKDGDPDGMMSKIKENKPYEFISIEHIGIIKDGKEDIASEEVKKWSGALENYTLKEKDGMTEVLVEMDSVDEYKEMFEMTKLVSKHLS